ncbi:MAG: hypothetical protein IKS68_01915 [Mailhella sp.]|nr:hypothetical protein [Mailhella sp.]
MDAILAIPASAGRAQNFPQAMQAESCCRLPGFQFCACRCMASAGAT